MSEESESKNGAITVLAQIQGFISATKNERNTFGKYSYRTAESILKAVKEALAGTDAAIHMTDDIVMMRDRVYIKSTASIRHIDGSKVESVSFAMEAMAQKGMSDPQMTGSSTSYARKYALGALLGIDDSAHDPDSRDNSNQNNGGAGQKATASSVDRINKLIESTSTDVGAIIKHYKVDGIGQLSSADADKVIKQLSKR